MRHLVLISEVSVLDVLGQPVSCIVNPGRRNWGLQASHCGKEGIVLVDVLIKFFSWVKAGLLKETFLMNKVVFITLQTAGKEGIIISVGFQVFHTFKQGLVLIVHVRVLK